MKLKFKDGTIIEVSDAKDKSKEEIIEEAKKVYKDFKDSQKSVKDSLGNESREELKKYLDNTEMIFYTKPKIIYYMGYDENKDTIYAYPKNDKSYREFENKYDRSIKWFDPLDNIQTMYVSITNKYPELKEIEFEYKMNNALEEYMNELYDENGKLKAKDSKKVKDEKSLEQIIKEVSKFQKNKNFDVIDFKKALEENGYEVESIENLSKTWKEHNGEYYKDYDIKLKDKTHIFFKLIADENYDTIEVIAYKNGVRDSQKSVKDSDEDITPLELIKMISEPLEDEFNLIPNKEELKNKNKINNLLNYLSSNLNSNVSFDFLMSCFSEIKELGDSLFVEEYNYFTKEASEIIKNKCINVFYEICKEYNLNSFNPKIKEFISYLEDYHNRKSSYVNMYKDSKKVKDSLSEEIEKLYNAIISKDKKTEEKLRKGLERLGMDRFTQNELLKDLHKEKKNTKDSKKVKDDAADKIEVNPKTYNWKELINDETFVKYTSSSIVFKNCEIYVYPRIVAKDVATEYSKEFGLEAEIKDLPAEAFEMVEFEDDTVDLSDLSEKEYNEFSDAFIKCDKAYSAYCEIAMDEWRLWGDSKKVKDTEYYNLIRVYYPDEDRWYVIDENTREEIAGPFESLSESDRAGYDNLPYVAPRTYDSKKVKDAYFKVERPYKRATYEDPAEYPEVTIESSYSNDYLTDDYIYSVDYKENFGTFNEILDNEFELVEDTNERIEAYRLLDINPEEDYNIYKNKSLVIDNTSKNYKQGSYFLEYDIKDLFIYDRKDIEEELYEEWENYEPGLD